MIGCCSVLQPVKCLRGSLYTLNVGIICRKHGEEFRVQVFCRYFEFLLFPANMPLKTCIDRGVF